MTIYYRPPTNTDGQKMDYQERRADRREADAERRAQQNKEPMVRDSIYDLSYDQRRRLRRAEAQGRREAEQRAVSEEKAREQAELENQPEHERRPRNPWRDLIEMRRKDAWRKDVARRIRIYEEEAARTDDEIDRLMAEKTKRHGLESSSEYARCLGHLERVCENAAVEERETLARLQGLVEGGDFAGYWRDCQPLLDQRLQRIRQQVVEQAARQAPLAEETRELEARQREAEELTKETTPVESDEPAETPVEADKNE